MMMAQPGQVVMVQPIGGQPPPPEKKKRKCCGVKCCCHPCLCCCCICCIIFIIIVLAAVIYFFAQGGQDITPKSIERASTEVLMVFDSPKTADEINNSEADKNSLITNFESNFDTGSGSEVTVTVTSSTRRRNLLQNSVEAIFEILWAETLDVAAIIAAEGTLKASTEDNTKLNSFAGASTIVGSVPTVTVKTNVGLAFAVDTDISDFNKGFALTAIQQAEGQLKDELSKETDEFTLEQLWIVKKTFGGTMRGTFEDPKEFCCKRWKDAYDNLDEGIDELKKQAGGAAQFIPKIKKDTVRCCILYEGKVAPLGTYMTGANCATVGSDLATADPNEQLQCDSYLQTSNQ